MADNEPATAFTLSNREILIKLREYLLKSQYSSKNRKLIQKVKLLYYDQNNNRTIKQAKIFRAQFGSCLWRLMLTALDERLTSPSIYSKNMILFFKKLALVLGTIDDMAHTDLPEDIKNGSCQPFFMSVLQLVTLVIRDNRSEVRLNVLQILLEVLENKFEDPAYLKWRDHRGVREKLLSALNFRISDESPPVRIVAIKCLKYFLDHENIVQTLKYLKAVMVCERNSEIRAQIVSFLSLRPTMKTKFFVRATFDPSPAVRTLAIKELVNRDIVAVLELKKMESIFKQFLLHPAMDPSPDGLVISINTINDIFRQEIFPSWIQKFDGKLDVLMAQMTNEDNLYKKILDSLYLDDSDATFAKVDISFLNEDRLIPVDKLDIEQCYIWMYLLNKFKNQHTTLRLMLPSQEKVPEYFMKITEGAINENKEATFQGREELATNVECLAIAFQLIPFYSFEEGNSKKIKKVIVEVLKNEIMDEISLLATAVQALQLIDPINFELIITDVLKELLEPRHLEYFDFPMSPRVNPPSPAGRKVDDVMEVDEEVPPTVETQIPPTQQSVNTTLFSQASSVMSQSFARKPSYSETQFKEAMAKLMLEINKLQQVDSEKEFEDEKEFVTRHQHLLLLKETLTKFRSVRDGTSKMEDLNLNDWKIANCQPIIPPNNNTLQNSQSPAKEQNELMHKRLESLIINPQIEKRISDERIPEFDSTNYLEQMDNAVICRCIVIMKAFLVYGRRIPPIIRNFYEKYAMQFLIKGEDLFRCYTIEFLTLMALLDRCYARDVLLVLLTAVESDVEAVKCYAFKGIADIFCQYPFSQLILIGSNVPQVTDARILPFDSLSNGEVKSDKEIEHAVVEILKKYEIAKINNDASTVNLYKQQRQELIIKTIMKLLMCGRFTQPETISDVLLYWTDPYNEFSNVKSMCENFVTHYVRKSAENANIMINGLIESLRILLESLKDDASVWRAKNAIFKNELYKTTFFVKLLMIVERALHPAALVTIYPGNYETFHPQIMYQVLKLIFTHIENEWVCELFCIYEMLTFTSPGEIQKFQCMTQVIIKKVESLIEDSYGGTIHLRNCKKELQKRFTRFKRSLFKSGFKPMVLVDTSRIYQVSLENIVPEEPPQDGNLLSDEENQSNVELPTPNQLEENDNRELEQSLLEFQEV